MHGKHSSWKTLFSWNRRERLGILLLSFALMLLVLSNFFYKQLFYSPPALWPQDSIVYYQSILDSMEHHLASEKQTKSTNSKMDTLVPKIPFNPDTMRIEHWVKMGMSEKQARVIINFKTSIGGFKSIRDFSKCYIIDERMAKTLTPYMVFYAKQSKQQIHQKKHPIEPKQEKNKPDKPYIELNSADSLQLISVSGIGPFYANQIITYRVNLGGFYTEYQLLELWKMDSSRLAPILPQVWVDTSKISYLSINTCSREQLASHPYLNWKQAEAIINYRYQHRRILSLSELKSIPLFSDSTLNRIEPYLDFK